MDVGDITHVDDSTVDAFDRQIIGSGDVDRRGVQIDRVFECTDLLGPYRGDEVLDRQGVDDVVCGNAVGVQRLLVEVGLDLADFAAIRQRDRGSGDRGQLRTDEAGCLIEQDRLGELLARQRELQDRHTGGVEVQDRRRRDAGRHLFQHRLRHRGNLRQRRVDVYGRLKENLDDSIIWNRLRFDMLDVVDAGRERALVEGDDATRHIIGRKAGIAEDDTDHRNVDVGEDVGRRAEGRCHPEDQD